MDEEFYYTGHFTNCTKDERDYFKSKSCLLTISVGQTPHEGNKFRTTLNLINSHFKICTIAVNDTLQRHTNSLNYPEMSEDQLFEYSLKQGKEWIERNMPIIKEELCIPYKIARWEKWFNNAQYLKDIVIINQLYDSNIGYQKIINEVADSFVKRYSKKIEDYDYQKAFNCSKKYLLEECAAMLQWFEEDCDYEIYPSIRNDAISETFRLLEPEKNKALLLPIGVKLIKHLGTKKVLDLNKLATDNIIKLSPGHIYWKNIHGAFAGCNSLQAKGFSQKNIKSMIGKSDFDLLDYETAFKIRKNDLEVMKLGKTTIYEESTVVNGKRSTYISHKSPVKDENGSVVGIVGVSIDITNQKNLEKELTLKTAELEKALDVKTEFLNNISHEIRTPVHGVATIANELLKQWDSLTEEKRYYYLEEIAKNSNRLTSMLGNILDLAKSVDGHLILDKSEVDLNQIIEEMIDESNTLYLRGKNIKFNFTPQRLPKLEADYERISQVVRNLFTNAIKYSPDNSIINIAAKTEGNNNIKFSISDEGVGIPEGELEAIFLPFTQSTRTNTKSGGTGLGLAISSKIIAAHGGLIWAENNIEKGASFYFEIPLHPNSEKASVVTQESTEIIPHSILIIDDEDACLVSLELLLNSPDYVVTKANGGKAGLNALKSGEKFDLILLDMMMPDIYGLDVLKVVLNDKKSRHIPVIIQSGISDQKEIQKALNLGAAGYIKKPYQREILIDNINKVLSH